MPYDSKKSDQNSKITGFLLATPFVRRARQTPRRTAQGGKQSVSC
jgi:hypothetical protein